MKCGLMCSLILLSLLLLSPHGFAKSPHLIKHTVLEDETAWFLASVYYGNGSMFPKLLESNQLTRAEDMKVGMEISIEDPKFHREQAGFASRYAKLWEGRQKALGLNSGSALPNAKVVIPTETIRSQDSLKKLPFNELSHSVTPNSSRAPTGRDE
jgi:hypothetical protein